MGRKQRDYSGHVSKYKRLTVFLVCVVLVLAVGVVGFNLTESKKVQKAQKTNSKIVEEKNKDYEQMEHNPLKLESNMQVVDAVKVHFAKQPSDKSFVESYDKIQVYTKVGKHKDTYVAFVRYDMKIKDIFTKVPGLETLYVVKDKKSAKYKVGTDVEDNSLKEYLKTIAQHEDVKDLMTDVDTDYRNALESDALLREALIDLKNAYENSTGTNSEE